MEGQNGRLLPSVREHETNKELVWKVELPAHDRLTLTLDRRVLTVRIAHSIPEHPSWVSNPDAAAS